ncbi:MAG TPA: hypothetical protein PKE26_07240 [Kiritimatiellia bacterium]|nr:hypothetical protein [Kiritimatiellia bacterium]HMO98885.1 hypothetical protein [Kiritimatiellia bacterium]HMP96247.1 hypothetical protein [Kiritimatiellia bacterium]
MPKKFQTLELFDYRFSKVWNLRRPGKTFFPTIRSSALQTHLPTTRLPATSASRPHTT